MKKLHPDIIPSIVTAYQNDYISMAELATQYSVTRMSIWKVLHAHGVNTSKKAAHIQTKCFYCQKPIIKIRCSYRKTLNHFCSRTCTSRWLNRTDPQTPYISNRHSLKLARKKVSQYILLQPGFCVHHEDRNQNNNTLSNLRVFATPADHLRYHRLGTPLPIWDGRITTPHP